MAKVGAESLEAAMRKLMRQYGEEVEESLKSDLQYAAELTTNEVSRNSPKRTGKYASGWDYSYFATRYGDLRVVVHDTTRPSLTHLLEKGHMNLDGSWTSGRKHIEPAYEKGRQALERRLANG